MVQHPTLEEREIPFVILANKQDVPGAVEEFKMRKILQIDRLKASNPYLNIYLKPCTGKSGAGVVEAFTLFEGFS